MKINPWTASLLLLFRPARLKEIAHSYNEYINRPDVQKAKIEEERKAPTYEHSIDRIRQGLLYSFLLVLGSFIVAALIGRACTAWGGRAPGLALETLQYAGIGVLLWATLAKQGWSIQTMHGATVPEVVNEFLYRALYVVGSFLLALSVTLQVA